MYEFHAEDWFHITGRGWACTMGAAQIPEGMWDPGVLVNQRVIVDGKEYTVKGVEIFRTAISPSVDWPYKQSFGLLIGER